MAKMETGRNISESLFQALEELLDGEYRLSQAIPPCITIAASTELAKALGAYATSSQENAFMLKELINKGPDQAGFKNRVIEKLVSSTKDMLSSLEPGPMGDVLMTSCIQTINDYKLRGYSTALELARQSGSNDNVISQIEKILEMERASAQVLKTVSANINKASGD